jgi:hypothetical protein
LAQIADALVVRAGVLDERGDDGGRANALREAASLYARKGNLVSERATRQALEQRSLPR